MGIKECILNILSYDQYSWYVNMYIGLYLLIPFLNRLWQVLDKEEKILLISVLIMSTALPSIVNVFDFYTDGAFRNSGFSTKYSQIVPDWWKNSYPLTYYFIGTYLKSI